MIIKMVSEGLAYCNQCHLPGTCGEFKLSGSNHTFKVCGACLEKMSKDINPLTKAEVPKEVHDESN